MHFLFSITLMSISIVHRIEKTRFSCVFVNHIYKNLRYIYIYTRRKKCEGHRLRKEMDWKEILRFLFFCLVNTELSVLSSCYIYSVKRKTKRKRDRSLSRFRKARCLRIAITVLYQQQQFYHYRRL